MPYTVRNYMSTGLITVLPGNSLKTANDLMQDHWIHHLPVVSEHMEVLGILSQRDVLRSSVSTFADIDIETKNQIDSGIPVSEIMVRDLVTISPETSLQEAGAMLMEKRIGCLLVTEHSRLVGIITKSDFLKMVMDFLAKLESPVRPIDI